jgi:type 1 glutamine amidotransferase
MRTFAIYGAALAVVGVLATSLGACSDGTGGLTGSAGSAGTGSTTGGTGSTTGGVSAIPGAGSGTVAGTAGTSTNPTGGTGSNPGTGGTTDAGTGGAAPVGGSAPTAGSTGMGGSPATGGLRTGPFKMLMLSTTLEYHHPSIAACTTMLKALGAAGAPERATIPGLAADSTWTVDEINPDPQSANYFSEVTAENLKSHEMFYSNNPTGGVFTNAPDGANKKAIFQAWFDGGGGWAGQHSATDFENNNKWGWFDDHVAGGWFTEHDNDGTPGTITWESQFVDHPIIKGLMSPWSTSDEWYIMNRNIEAVPGFKILGKVTGGKVASARPAVWITENDKGGRAFYTIRGHADKVYAEPEFRQLMLRGILWSVHRLPGGN